MGWGSGRAGGGATGEKVALQSVGNESRTSTIAVSDSSELQLALGSTGWWEFEAVLLIAGAAAGDVRLAFDGPAQGALHIGYLGPGITPAVHEGDQINRATEAYATEVVLGVAGGTDENLAIIKGIAFLTATGTLKLRWAQGTSSGTASNILQGSYMKARPIADVA